MNWKNWPYWVKGGIWGSVLSIILEIILGLYIYVSDNSTILSQTNAATEKLQLQLMRGVIPDSIFTLDTLLNCLYLTIVFLLIGVFVGWLYGKIKSRYSVVI